MNQQPTQHACPYDPNRLLDSVMQHLGISGDKALSDELKIARNVLRKLRSGCLPIGASMLLWISESTGTSIHELRAILGDRRAKARLNYALLAHEVY